MKSRLLIFIGILLSAVSFAQEKKSTDIPTVYVDKNGVMRWSDTKEETSFFGVNYTLPFAHAYRAMGYLGVDRKEAIDRDVYHLTRLGINAYRIHVWDVEISDAQGRLLENEHLDLLDYLIYKLKERGIHTFVTAQTNFGNGYPERNQPTEGYSYNYGKCEMHSHPEAIAAQEHYLAALVRHVNPYTGYAYKDDPAIVGFEINNEPCHTGSVEQTRAYINRMLRAMKQAGCRKPVFYNVSHNQQVVEAYYSTGIDGTTYQWYPIGLVSGRMQKGNFLPFVDSYRIPFSHLKGFDKKARMIYEFDPADILYSYMYPATVRTFRSAGFQWITQFAYDPIDMAAYNTEYQTHYLNVAYTPNKAIGLMIASEAAQQVKRGETFGTYPADTVFHDFRVSAACDLSELNDGEKFYYSNTTHTQPKNVSQLCAIAGCGSSPVVGYEGTGVYWLDKLEEGIWRLEVMPDAVVASDPFAKPSLEKPVVRIFQGTWDMSLDLPDLGDSFYIEGLNEGNTCKQQAVNGVIAAVRPGVYLLQRNGWPGADSQWKADTHWKHIRLGEYVAPRDLPKKDTFVVTHTPAAYTETGRNLLIEAIVAGEEKPDSVVIYTDKISFWNDYNPSVRMEHIEGYRYQATIPAEEVKEGCFRYNLMVCKGNLRQTFPAGVAQSPLDWDYTADSWWETQVVSPQAPLRLLDARQMAEGVKCYTFPEWSKTDIQIMDEHPDGLPYWHIGFHSEQPEPVFFVHRYVRDDLSGRMERLDSCQTLCLKLDKQPEGMLAGFVTTDGYTYLAHCPKADGEGVVRIPLSKLRQDDTALLPHAYPVFLDPYFHPQASLPFHPRKIEKLELRMKGQPHEKLELQLASAWLE